MFATPTESGNTVDWKSDEKILIIETQKGLSVENYFSNTPKRASKTNFW